MSYFIEVISELKIKGCKA